MLLKRERELVVDYCRKMVNFGLTKGNSGNISIYNKEEGLMAISPTGLDYFVINPIDIVVMDLDGNKIEGDWAPSSEYEVHALFYRNRSDIGAILHCHSPFCTTLSALSQPILPVHYSLGTCGQDKVDCAPYATYGTTELAEITLQTCGENKAVLLANHGLIACGEDIEEAFTIAENMEFTAEIQYRCLAIGEVQVISDENMKKYFAKAKAFGHPNQR